MAVLRTRRDSRAPLWHGTAFIVEALVLMAFLMAALAVFLRLFAGAQGIAVRGAQLSEAVLIAQNAAEEFAAGEEPVGDGTPVEASTTRTGPKTGTVYTVTVTVSSEPAAAGSLVHAAFAVQAPDETEPLYTLDTERYDADSATAVSAPTEGGVSS